jgi:hypothetical protein
MKTQAWGWLAAAVLAAGLNSSYHEGGMQWAHEIVDRVGHNTGAVLALATGRADQFLAETRMLKVDREAPQCPLATAMAQVQSSFDQPNSEIDRFEAMSAREQAQLARLEANRARMEARIQARLARVQFSEANFSPVVVRVPKIACPRVRVNIPRMPTVKMPQVPAVHVDYSGPGPI